MTISSLISSRPQVIETAVKVVLTWTILIGQFASGDDFCDSMSGDPTDECASELSCYGCTVPITNLNETLQETFSECIHSDSVGGHLAKCYKTDAKACAVVKIYNVKDQAVKPYYFRGCVGDEDDHYKQVCVTTNTVLLRRFCYNTIRAVFGTNLPVGKNDEDMANWNCVSICCGCNGCNKNFVSLDLTSDQCKATVQNNSVENLRDWYRSSMDRTAQLRKTTSFELKSSIILIIFLVAMQFCKLNI